MPITDRPTTTGIVSARACGESTQSGGALLFVMIVMSVLTFVAVFGLKTGLDERKSATRHLHAKTGGSCAETALERGRALAAANQDDWNTILGGGTVGWYPPQDNCPGSDVYSYRVTIRDNVDETPPATNDTTADTDSTIILDAEVFQSSDPTATDATSIARVSGLVSASSTTIISDYGKQDGMGSAKSRNH